MAAAYQKRSGGQVKALLIVLAILVPLFVGIPIVIALGDAAISIVEGFIDKFFG